MNWRNWCYKQNRTIAGCVATIVFSCIVFTVIYSLLITPEPYEYNKSRSYESINDKCVVKDCEISCQSLNEQEIQERIIDAIDNNCGNIKKLNINNTHFPMKTIEANWLQGVSQNVIEINFMECHFITIKPGAFVGHPFNKLVTLNIVEARVKVFLKDSFSNIPNLQIFSYVFYQKFEDDLTVEVGAFENLNSLHTLQITHCIKDPQTILNITGLTYFQDLATVDFQYNKLETIFSSSFSKAPALIKLLLSHNLLTSIDKNAFFEIYNLQSIYLDTNRLSTMEEGIFDMINHKNHIGVITAHANPWICDCNLAWFQDFVLKENSSVPQDTPPLCNGVNFNETIFCSTTKSTTTTTTELTTTDTITENICTTNLNTDPTTTELNLVSCTDISESTYDFPSDTIRTFVEQKLLILENNYIYLDFYDWDHDTINTQINIRSNTNNHNLIYRNADIISDLTCLKQIPKTLMLNLNRNSTYVMCLVDHTFKNKVPPQACFGIKILEEMSARTWLQNSDKITTITISIVAILLSILITSIIVFYCIRQNPKLISGNKRVIIVGTKETEAIVMPKNYQVPSYITPAPDMGIPSGYMTPNADSVLYDKINYMAALKRKRSDSRQSIINHVNAVPTKIDQLIHQQVNPMDYEIYVERGCPLPPPLPPFHPSQRYVNDDFEEEEEDHYSSV